MCIWKSWSRKIRWSWKQHRWSKWRHCWSEYSEIEMSSWSIGRRIRRGCCRGIRIWWRIWFKSMLVRRKILMRFWSLRLERKATEKSKNRKVCIRMKEASWKLWVTNLCENEKRLKLRRAKGRVKRWLRIKLVLWRKVENQSIEQVLEIILSFLSREVEERIFSLKGICDETILKFMMTLKSELTLFSRTLDLKLNHPAIRFKTTLLLNQIFWAENEISTCLKFKMLIQNKAIWENREMWTKL